DVADEEEGVVERLERGRDGVLLGCDGLLDEVARRGQVLLAAAAELLVLGHGRRGGALGSFGFRRRRGGGGRRRRPGPAGAGERQRQRQPREEEEADLVHATLWIDLAKESRTIERW